MSLVKSKTTYRTAKTLLKLGDSYKHIAILLLRESYWQKGLLK